MTLSLAIVLVSLSFIKQIEIDSMLLCVWSVIDHSKRQNVVHVRTSMTHSPAARVPLFCSYNILTSSAQNRRMVTWHLFC